MMQRYDLTRREYFTIVQNLYLMTNKKERRTDVVVDQGFTHNQDLLNVYMVGPVVVRLTFDKAKERKQQNHPAEIRVFADNVDLGDFINKTLPLLKKDHNEVDAEVKR